MAKNSLASHDADEVDAVVFIIVITIIIIIIITKINP